MPVDHKIATITLWAPFQSRADPLVPHQSPASAAGMELLEWERSRQRSAAPGWAQPPRFPHLQVLGGGRPPRPWQLHEESEVGPWAAAPQPPREPHTRVRGGLPTRTGPPATPAPSRSLPVQFPSDASETAAGLAGGCPVGVAPLGALSGGRGPGAPGSGRDAADTALKCLSKSQ